MNDPWTPYARCEGTPVDRRTDGPGITRYDPAAKTAPLYQLLETMRAPLPLRDIMIAPVRTGYIGQDREPDPATRPAAPEALYPDVSVFDAYVPGPDGPIRCQVFRKAAIAPGAPFLLYVHGGGFTVGRSEDTAFITTRIASENGLTVVSVNYRLAPEWPFPHGLDDTLAVFRFLREHGAALGGDPGRIAVAGDSAGGNFAAALPLRAAEAGLATPEAAILLCPVTDFLFEDHPSFERLAPSGAIFDAAFLGYVRAAYCVIRDRWTHPHVSPARADLSGFPPALVVSGGVDPLLDENRAFVERLQAAGATPVESFVGEDLDHGFYFFPGMFAEGDAVFGRIRAFLGHVF